MRTVWVRGLGFSAVTGCRTGLDGVMGLYMGHFCAMGLRCVESFLPVSEVTGLGGYG